jgi:hypothetical protein
MSYVNQASDLTARRRYCLTEGQGRSTCCRGPSAKVAYNERVSVDVSANVTYTNDLLFTPTYSTKTSVTFSVNFSTTDVSSQTVSFALTDGENIRNVTITTAGGVTEIVSYTFYFDSGISLSAPNTVSLNVTCPLATTYLNSTLLVTYDI